MDLKVTILAFQKRAIHLVSIRLYSLQNNINLSMFKKVVNSREKLLILQSKRTNFSAKLLKWVTLNTVVMTVFQMSTTKSQYPSRYSPQHNPKIKLLHQKRLRKRTQSTIVVPASKNSSTSHLYSKFSNNKLK